MDSEWVTANCVDVFIQRPALRQIPIGFVLFVLLIKNTTLAETFLSNLQCGWNMFYVIICDDKINQTFKKYTHSYTA